MSGRTPTTQVYANPDGTWTSVQSLVPRFARTTSGSWVDADPTLRRQPDGTYAPVAALFDMVFSGGGGGPLATMRKGDRSISLSWPGRLPAPVVAGATATYPNVRPGVDLQLVASVDGFSHVLVIKTAAAAANKALSTVDFALSTTGLTLRRDVTGSTIAADSRGAAVFTAPTPMMWDSRGADPAGGGTAVTGGRAAAGNVAAGGTVHMMARMAPVGTSLAAGRLRLTPAAGMLTDPTTVYPVYLDPPWSGTIDNNAWTTVWSRTDVQNNSFWQNGTAMLNGTTKGELGSGLVCDDSVNGSCTSPTYKIRTLMRMTLAGLAGKHLIYAAFDITQGWSWTCNPASNAQLWYIDGGISASTTWNNQPSWNTTYVAQAPASHRVDGAMSCAGTGTVEFNATGIVQHALDLGSGTVTVGLQAVSETTVLQWKRWFHSTAMINATYNSYPTTGAQSTTPATACVSGNGSTPAANRPVINTTTPTLAMVVNDADTTNSLQGDFDWDTWNGTAWVHAGAAVDPIGRAGGGTSSITVNLSEGTFRWRARVDDPFTFNGGNYVDYSPYSGWCELAISTAPPSVPEVSSAEYYLGCEDQDACGGVGQTATFTIDGIDSNVTGYYWGLSDPPANFVAAPSPGQPAIIHWTPTVGGSYFFYAQSVNSAGSTRSAPPYPVNVRPASGPYVQWPMNDPVDNSTLFDATGNGGDATLIGEGATLGRPGRIVGGDTALGMNGDPDTFAVSPYDVAPIHTVSLATWAKLADTATTYMVVSQSSDNGPGLTLGYDKPTNRWMLAVSPDGAACADPCASWRRITSSAPPAVGRWTHLAFTYDAAAGRYTFYVNGVSQGTVAGVALWDAGAQARIGGDYVHGYNGSLAQLQIWNRVLFDTEIRAMVDATLAGDVGQWHFSEVDGTVAFDSSNYAHDLDLIGGASIPPSGAGHDGTGLLLMDGTGSAESESPVLYTGQSFTVAAWANLTNGGTDRVLIAQDGAHSSPFALMYSAANGGHWTMRMYNVDSATDRSAVSATAPATAALNVWTYLTGVYDAPAGQIRLYVDGALVATQAVAGGWDSEGVFTIGRDLAGGAPDARWVGAIDEARAWAGVVAQMSGDWRFTQCTGSPVHCTDGAAVPHDLVLGSGATVVGTGHDLTSGLSFDGTGSGASTTVSPIASDSSLTVSAWVYLTASGSSRTAVSQAGTYNSAFSLGYDAAAGGRWTFAMTDADSASSSSGAAASAGPVSLNTWTHLTGVYDKQQSQLSLYVNGNLVATTTFVHPWNATGGLVVGSDKGQGSVRGKWLGTVDDVRIYQGVLTDVSTLE